MEFDLEKNGNKEERWGNLDLSNFIKYKLHKLVPSMSEYRQPISLKLQINKSFWLSN